jgi:DNA-damage-inducible protein J
MLILHWTRVLFAIVAKLGYIKIINIEGVPMKAAIVRARIDQELKTDVEHVLAKLGLSVSEAISLFMAQIKLKKGIPFDIRVPNEETLKTFEDTDAGRNLVHCKDAQDMFKKLGI